MRHADMFTAATRPTQASAPTPAAASPARATLPAGNASFGSVFRQVQQDVATFISKGDGGAAPALSPEGRVLLGRSQPAGAARADEAELAELQQQFLASIKPWAAEAGRKLGVAPDIIAAHAALESGWGQRPLRQGDGGDSNNLFGVKAGGQWRGDVTAALTTEYEGGAALKKTERFRSYPDQASAFRDYAQVLLDNPRYRAAIGAGDNAGAFAQGLARGGYATDPAYADKLTRLATRLQRAGTAAQSDD
ncbi:flagellar assembly peptidoglycan hydrolase FlgJ [Janthinobacterium fluminis]|uniref:Flagellar assembly peptidoglycan hydrolase FlgJ n=1 Tax=Janthinobacterium fluminis TaxID=2987524 RepID=A0ABT5JVH5_9BURK|nr:flagellar assembly peptidoglycan hydrolase FlgJ [Janthinobacterium fluminis]MDC8756486.1 flagellar assembly peptidoglycan hydrolase FlgJ [Janthinobacterium fluminis]